MRVIRDGLSAVENQLYDSMDRVLRNHWTPVADLTAGSYQRCLDELFRLALADNSFVAIAQHMRELAVEMTRRQSDANDHLAVAETIRKLKHRFIPSKAWADV